MAKIATNWLKISCAATFGPSLGGHKLVIFYPFLTFDHQNDQLIEMIQALYHSVQILVF